MRMILIKWLILSFKSLEGSDFKNILITLGRRIPPYIRIEAEDMRFVFDEDEEMEEHNQYGMGVDEDYQPMLH